MMTACAQNLRNERGEGGGVFAVRRETGRSVKMAKMAAQIFGIATVGSQENSCSTLLTSVSYAKWPTAFVGGVSYGKSRVDDIAVRHAPDIDEVAISDILFLTYREEKKMDTPKKNTENTILIVLLIIAIIAAFVEWNKARMLSQDLNTAQAQLLTRQAQLENDQMQLKNDQMQLENAQTALSTPRIPVTVNFREADGGFFGGGPGQGLVGDFKNTSDSTLTVIGTFTNPTLNQTVQKTWIMNPGQLVIIGYRQGYAFASGDTILLSSAGYESFRFTVK